MDSMVTISDSHDMAGGTGRLHSPKSMLIKLRTNIPKNGEKNGALAPIPALSLKPAAEGVGSRYEIRIRRSH